MARVEVERGLAIQTYLRANPDAALAKRDRELRRIAERYPSFSFMSWAAAQRNRLEHEWERSKARSTILVRRTRRESDRVVEARVTRRR
jgi:hypothetical protein